LQVKQSKDPDAAKPCHYLSNLSTTTLHLPLFVLPSHHPSSHSLSRHIHLILHIPNQNRTIFLNSKPYRYSITRRHQIPRKPNPARIDPQNNLVRSNLNHGMVRTTQPMRRSINPQHRSPTRPKLAMENITQETFKRAGIPSAMPNSTYATVTTIETCIEIVDSVVESGMATWRFSDLDRFRPASQGINARKGRA
jgi:hypothetical protein